MDDLPITSSADARFGGYNCRRSALPPHAGSGRRGRPPTPSGRSSLPGSSRAGRCPFITVCTRLAASLPGMASTRPRGTSPALVAPGDGDLRACRRRAGSDRRILMRCRNWQVQAAHRAPRRAQSTAAAGGTGNSQRKTAAADPRTGWVLADFCLTCCSHGRAEAKPRGALRRGSGSGCIFCCRHGWSPLVPGAGGRCCSTDSAVFGQPCVFA